jgi:GTP-binding protein
LSAFLQARFLTSAAKPADFPPEAGPELAFAGRSNVGKSSAINALAGRKRLAFFSRTPGRTQTINFFDLGNEGRLADLPGYGYASAPKSTRAGWDALIGGYLTGRPSLAGVVILMDARHPLTANDRQFLQWLRPVQAARLVLLSKSDKLTRAERAKALAATRAALDASAMSSEIALFSSKTNDGVDETRGLLERWLRK